MRNQWTDKHHTIFMKYVPWGYETIQRKLKEGTGDHFSIRALHHYASRNMIEVGLKQNEVPLSWLATESNGTAYRPLIAAAVREGVIRKSKSKGGKYVVPVEWADRMADVIKNEGLEGIKKYNRKNRKPKSKHMKADVVKAIRRNRKNLTPIQLAQKYDVHPETIVSILRNRTYKDVK